MGLIPMSVVQEQLDLRRLVVVTAAQKARLDALSWTTATGQTFTHCTMPERAVLDEAYAIPDAVLHAPITHAEKLYPLCDAIQRWRRSVQPQTQHAPAPDYHMTEAVDGAEPVEVCSCEEALALRAQLAHLRAIHDTDAMTCREALDRVDEVTAELAALRGRVEQLEAETAHLRAKNRVAEAELAHDISETVSLRTDVEHYRSLWEDSRATVEGLVAERDALRGRLQESDDALRHYGRRVTELTRPEAER